VNEETTIPPWSQHLPPVWRPPRWLAEWSCRSRLQSTAATTSGSRSKLTAEDLAVYAVDLRGGDASDGERFYVEQFAEYVGDVSRW